MWEAKSAPPTIPSANKGETPEMRDEFEERLTELESKVSVIDGTEASFRSPGGKVTTLEEVSQIVELLRIRVSHLENQALKRGESVADVPT